MTVAAHDRKNTNSRVYYAVRDMAGLNRGSAGSKQEATAMIDERARNAIGKAFEGIMGRDWNEIFENGAEIFFDLVPPFVFQLVTLADLETSLAYADFDRRWLIYEFSMLASATIFKPLCRSSRTSTSSSSSRGSTSRTRVRRCGGTSSSTRRRHIWTRGSRATTRRSAASGGRLPATIARSSRPTPRALARYGDRPPRR